MEVTQANVLINRVKLFWVEVIQATFPVNRDQV
jgi:hypothetical protein